MVKKVSYGAVSFATLSLGLLVNAYGYDFYVQLGALLPVLSLFTALARSCDIATDMCMAWFSDNARTPYGRRRPFMALGCIPYGVLFFLFFTPPTTLGPIEVSFYFGIFYILFYLSDTVSTVPYDALGPELTSDYDVRPHILSPTILAT
jgi:GPH family glycoside/pentoside/hexuronide:cation symporter